MAITNLKLSDSLPLTCSRSGSCCHGNVVMLNPWELARLAQEKGIEPRAFRDLYSEFGGIQLRFDGQAAWGKKKSCSQYVEGLGCSVHLGRPLACRLFPLGRQIQNNEAHYMHQGDTFPCLNDCPEVLELTKMRVDDYLQGQATEPFETAQDTYLELVQNMADIAFELLLETGLSKSGDRQTLSVWRTMGQESPEGLAARIGQGWIDDLMIPKITEKDPILFAQKHDVLLSAKAQEKFGTLKTNQEFHLASVLMMALALHLARSIGAHPGELADHWISIAKSHGALE